ncbi:uncharacterized protein LOC105383825 [Plutella xylostella]|uniref:uncharacterized protein LOC105383825 n=1 Tax=Plutella xylostella TaxID=51655 RepID=UPI002032727B|nr:uncharacterized protein LOC105383825 [Plutella xylostella]
MSSPGAEGAGGGGERALRLSVRKDLFPQESQASSAAGDSASEPDLDDVSCVKLETDFEQSIDEIAKQKVQASNGALPSTWNRHRKHKQSSRRSKPLPAVNGSPPKKSKKRKSSSSEWKPHRTSSHSVVPSKVKGGKNLNLVSSSECQESEEEAVEEELEDEDSSEDEVLNKCILKLPLISAPRQSGKPYSHELSQLKTKKSKSKDSNKERRTRAHAVTPCSGKPRSMLDICSSKSKKKSKKSESKPTYHSQIVGGTMKIKIKRTSIHEVVTNNTSLPVQFPPAPLSIADIGQRKSKKKRAASPVASESSGEEYNPSKGDTAAAITVAAPKPRHPPPKAKRTRNRGKSEKTERSKVQSASAAAPQDSGPQSPWATMPEEVLTLIFDHVVNMQGTLPAVIRLGRVCKLWHSVSCKPQLWRNVDLAQYTSEKCKTDFKLVWLLENRLSRCHTLNISHWKVVNVSWVLACLAEYAPGLRELSVAGWSRLAAEQLHELLAALPRLRRLDLSHTSETGGSGTCLSAQSIARLVESFGERLTHLTMAHNKFSALQQILTSIASHCPNLEVLDISGARATSHPGAVPLEALQKGCPKLRVFRAASAQLILVHATTSQQMEITGWEHLEELSIAAEAATERVAVGEYKLGDEALSRLVRGATRLRLLDLRNLQQLTDSGLVRVPAWDLQHLFLGGCNILRQKSACLELICEKWSHSLIELDLSWASCARVLDDAVAALADTAQSRLRILNLCGSAVSLEPIKKVLLKCPHIESLNLSSCRALPRGMKRLYAGKELQDLKDSFDPEKLKKAKEEKEKSEKKTEKTEPDSKTESAPEDSPKNSDSSSTKAIKVEDKSTSSIFQEPRTPAESDLAKNNSTSKTSPDCKSVESIASKDSNLTSPSETKLASPIIQSKPDSSSTPRSETSKTDVGSPHYSPVARPDSRLRASPDAPPAAACWGLGQFKTTPTHKSEASPLNRVESHGKLKYKNQIEQCSPTTSQENKLSPENMPSIKQDNMKTPNSWNYGSYSPMPRESQFSQRSPYSTQPSPAQPSPYSAQPSPYSTQPSPYSSQPSPYSAQPSPDTSQIVKQDVQKSSGAWSSGNYSPLTKQPAPYSPHPAPYSPHPASLASPGPQYRAPPRPAPPADDVAAWGIDKFLSSNAAAAIESLIFGSPPLQHAPPPPADDPWSLGQYRVEPPHAPHMHNPFLDPASLSFDSLSAHIGHQGHIQNFIDDNYNETSRVD